MARFAAWHTHIQAHFTSTSALPFVSFSKQVLGQNVSHENGLIFKQMNVQVTYIFIPIILHKDSFCRRGKSKLGIGLFIHELLTEPLISSEPRLDICLPCQIYRQMYGKLEKLTSRLLAKLHLSNLVNAIFYLVF